MKDNWRNKAVSVTKFDPAFRDQNGHYTKNDWIGFFQVGTKIDGEVLSFQNYLLTEEKYINAAKWFFELHKCSHVLIRNLEKKDISQYDLFDKVDLLDMYDKLDNDLVLPVKEVGLLIKLILRELVWAEVFCNNDEESAIRFGYDFYMYLNSSKNLNSLFKKIEELGLFVD